jgi:23S rRNA (guanosine2251-2'-O)-methyltransferase
MKNIVLIAHNIRSTHNVGSLLRTAEGLGISHVYLTGYTPYPLLANDPRLPHLSRKISSQIEKTALGAEKFLSLSVESDVNSVIAQLKAEGFSIVALEQNDKSVDLKDFKAPAKMALVVGREVEGIEPEVLDLCDTVIEIPMRGLKESFNVVQAAAMALYSLML